MVSLNPFFRTKDFASSACDVSLSIVTELTGGRSVTDLTAGLYFERYQAVIATIDSDPKKRNTGMRRFIGEALGEVKCARRSNP